LLILLLSSYVKGSINHDVFIFSEKVMYIFNPGFNVLCWNSSVLSRIIMLSSAKIADLQAYSVPPSLSGVLWACRSAILNQTPSKRDQTCSTGHSFQVLSFFFYFICTKIRVILCGGLFLYVQTLLKCIVFTVPGQWRRAVVAVFPFLNTLQQWFPKRESGGSPGVLEGISRGGSPG